MDGPGEQTPPPLPEGDFPRTISMRRFRMPPALWRDARFSGRKNGAFPPGRPRGLPFSTLAAHAARFRVCRLRRRARHGGKPSIDNLSRTFRSLASKPGLLSGMNAALLSWSRYGRRRAGPHKWTKGGDDAYSPSFAIPSTALCAWPPVRRSAKTVNGPVEADFKRPQDRAGPYAPCRDGSENSASIFHAGTSTRLHERAVHATLMRWEMLTNPTKRREPLCLTN